MRTSGEEFQAAKFAAVARKAKTSLHEFQNIQRDSIRRNPVEIEISAARAVSIAREGDRHEPGIKAKIACVAAPGP